LLYTSARYATTLMAIKGSTFIIVTNVDFVDWAKRKRFFIAILAICAMVWR